MSSPDTKRRKIRKGTHSCWECKRRKMKCIFDPLSTRCAACRRRGSQCVSQEFPEAPNPGDQLIATEAETPSDGDERRRADRGILTPVSTTSEPFQYFAGAHRVGRNKRHDPTHPPGPQSKNERLSRFLHESLPSRDDTEMICKATRNPSVLAHELLTMPYTTLDQHGLKSPASLLESPAPDRHPVLIARHMLQLAVFLQHLHPDLHEELKDLSESPRAIMERLADLAISLVTTNDELLGSIEGLECVMIESMYQANVGNLRRSWVAGRRAMTMAQMMGLHRPDSRTQFQVLDPLTKCHPQLMWFRIVFLDRQLCLLLGLPQGCSSMAPDTLLVNDTPMGRLERIHCVLSSRILERNASHPSSPDYALTRSLDLELQRAARSLPSKWWLVPTLTATDSQALFWDTRRLFAQVLHYNLLNQLHLPYMLRASSAERKYEYSRITCVNASREVLSRFITLRSFNRIAYSCRTVDFLALMAAMTLLLAHLDSHHAGTENLLAHQYISDRAMIEQAQENMSEVNRLNSDALSAQSADLLRRLLTIEVEADGAGRVSVQEAESETPDDAVVTVNIPYFGIIKIAGEGMSKESSRPQATATTLRPAHRERSGSVSSDTLPQMPPGISNPQPMSPLDATTPGQPAPLAPQLHGPSDPLLPQGYPGLTAPAEDWAFQGVDMAFFESLMRSTGDAEGAEWTV
ncbi:hypothetical protein BDV28DRAFT_138533 [Aspergillus coremiiformis]|uniref:Zn(2)-C6 fungal-type domain-containing protein n=1 Tax=Aspergillus coremiiformis TaxID=138285 RepID=A0A5N6Z1Z9_9EURO|nr:hypothetical protein BDV28DRAFT_138533 [Aspergillus coremiiformis]